MRKKVMRFLIVSAICFSVILAFAMPLVNPAHADPMQTLTLNVSTTFTSSSNTRSNNLQVGDEVIQFTRPNLVVGSNPTGFISTVSHIPVNVSGDLSGTLYAEVQEFSIVWDELPANTAKGYAVETTTFDDGHGNTFSYIQTGDTDSTFSDPFYNGTSSGYVFVTTGTGIFAGKKGFGTASITSSYDTVTGMVSASGTITLRLYASVEISGPAAFTSTWTVTPGSQRALGTSIGSQPTDEFLQFTRTNINRPANDPVYYQEGGTVSGPTSGALTGTLTGFGINSIIIPGTSPANQGWAVAKWNYSDGSGTIDGISFADLMGDGLDSGFMFASTETGATGTYAGKEYYAPTTTNYGPPTIINGNLYTLEPLASLETATGTGLATFSSSSGTIQNLTAVSESSLPTEGKPNLQFPHGFFSFDITGLAPGESVTLTIELPSPVPITSEYWKYGPAPSDSTPHWYQIPMGDNDGDKIITITLIDGGLGDDDLTADGVIIDQGGPGNPPAGPGGGQVVSGPVFPNIYIGIAAAFGVAIIAYVLRRRLLRQV